MLSHELKRLRSEWHAGAVGTIRCLRVPAYFWSDRVPQMHRNFKVVVILRKVWIVTYPSATNIFFGTKPQR